MSKILFFFLLVAACELVPAQTQLPTGKQDFNLSFERFDAQTSLPVGWIRWGAGYSFSPDSAQRVDGRYSLRIEPDPNAGERQFGSCAFDFPAGYEGKTIQLRGYLKLEKVINGAVGLLLRVDGASVALRFDNMLSRNISGTQDWQQFQTQELSLPAEAERIFVGVILTGEGKLWADKLEVLIDGKDFAQAPRLKPKEYGARKDKEFDAGSGIEVRDLSRATLHNLSILCRVWGFVKYYHPAIASGEHNWDYELFRVLPRVLSARSLADRNNALLEWIQKLEPVSEVSRLDTIAVEGVKLTPDIGWIEQESELGRELVKKLIEIRDAKRTAEHYYIGMAPAIRNPMFKNETPYDSMRYPDPGFRLLAIFRYWNMIEYFFPYKHLIGTDWKSILEEFIPKFLDARDELGYKLAALQLIGRIHDSHANIWGKDEVLDSYKGNFFAPLNVTFIGDKAVVTGYLDEKRGASSGLTKGDVIVSVKDEPVERLIKRKLPLTPASNYATQLRDIAYDLLRSTDSTLSIQYLRDNSLKTATLICYPPGTLNLPGRFARPDTCWKFIKKDIGYIYPGSIKNEYLPMIMSQLKDTKGIIIDLRCYPSQFIVFTLGEYLMPRPTEFVKFTKGSIERPGLFTFTQPLKVGKENPRYYRGRVVILVNETTISQAEYTTMSFRVAPRATVIGSTTAAADGNVSQVALPGGIRSLISGIGVYYPDGRETQRVGIVPDIQIRPTIRGIRDGKDELLEKALEIIDGE